MKVRCIAYYPYHDWRKIRIEGERTRDAHCINALRKNDFSGIVLIINRPITCAELLIKKKTLSRKLKEQPVFEKGRNTLYKVDDKTYLIDTVPMQSINHILHGRNWYFEAYANSNFRNFVEECRKFLKMTKEDVLHVSANVMASGFFTESDNLIFDAWDNFLRMPGLAKIQNNLKKSYQNYASVAKAWTTNSNENIKYYQDHFQPIKLKLVTNGVNAERFVPGLQIPGDLKELKKAGNKIAGFGGKITHLFDFELFNYCAEKCPEVNFVIVGQVLDKSVFDKIRKSRNIFYLGDKSYDEYPNYVSNFDIGIVTYKVGEGQHGGDSIKVYEYLACGLDVVGTIGNGLQNLSDYLNLTNDKDRFVDFIKDPQTKPPFNADKYSWRQKVTEILKAIDGE